LKRTTLIGSAVAFSYVFPDYLVFIPPPIIFFYTWWSKKVKWRVHIILGVGIYYAFYDAANDFCADVKKRWIQYHEVNVAWRKEKLDQAVAYIQDTLIQARPKKTSSSE
jgi:hypothetical protein